MNIKIVNAPGGAGCKHVHVKNAAGIVLLDVLNRDDFGTTDDSDAGVGSPLRQRIRQAVKEYLAANPGATVAQIRTMLESKDF